MSISILQALMRVEKVKHTVHLLEVFTDQQLDKFMMSLQMSPGTVKDSCLTLPSCTEPVHKRAGSVKQRPN